MSRMAITDGKGHSALQIEAVVSNLSVSAHVSNGTKISCQSRDVKGLAQVSEASLP